MFEQIETVTIPLTAKNIWLVASTLYLFFGVLVGRSVYKYNSKSENAAISRDAGFFGGAAMFFWPIVVVAYLVMVFFCLLFFAIGWIVSVGISKEKK